MFFLARSLICIGVVYALALSDRAPSTSAIVGGVGSPAVAPSVTPERRPRLAESAKALVQQGVDALGAAARDRCLASPQACVEAVRKLNGSGAR